MACFIKEVIFYAKFSEFKAANRLTLECQRRRDWQNVVHTGSWLLGRDVLIAPAWINEIDALDRGVSVEVDQDAVKNAPAFDPDKPITADYELALFEHYGKHKTQT